MRISILPTADRSFSGVLNYNQKDASRLIGTVNTFARDEAELLRHFKFIQQANGRIKNPVFHVSFSLAYDEVGMSEEVLRGLIGDYMNAMGYGEQPYAIFEHQDKEHRHFHVVSTRVDARSGKKIPHSNEGRRTQEILKDLISKYDLGHRFDTGVKHGGGLVESVNEVVMRVLECKPHSWKIFDRLCQENGVIHKKTQRGNVFYMNEQDGGRQRAISASELSAFRKISLPRQLKANKELWKWNIRAVRKIVDEATLKSSTLDRLRVSLQDKGVQLITHENSRGLYGVSFGYKGFVFKGSSLGADYSWNILRKKIRKVAVSERHVVGSRRSVDGVATSDRRSSNRLYIGSANADRKFNKEREEEEFEAMDDL